MEPVADRSKYPLPRLRPLAGAVDLVETDARKRYELAHGDPPRPWGPVTGFPILDAELGGALEPGLHVFHAGPGAGKTAFALQVATQCGCPALYVSAEMLYVELMRRCAARHSGTFLGDFKNGRMNPETVRRKAEAAAAAYPDLSILDATRDGATIADVVAAAEVVKGKSENLLIVVDSIHSWGEGAAEAERERQAETDAEALRHNPHHRTPAPARPESEYELLNWTIGALRKLAARFECPVLGIAERSKGDMDSDDMGAAAGTRKFMYSAETVVGMKAEKEAGRTKPVLFTVPKNRHGQGYAQALFYFDGALQTFTEATREECRDHVDRLKEEAKASRGGRK